MSKTAQISNLLAVIIPFVAFIVAVVLLWGNGVGWNDLVVFAGMYLLTGFGITVGYHRMLTHRSFATSKPVEYLFAILGSMSVQGPVIEWVADHRKHHAHTDEEGDPHSPHVGSGSGLRGLVPRPRRLAGQRQGQRAQAQVRRRPLSRTRACA